VPPQMPASQLSRCHEIGGFASPPSGRCALVLVTRLRPPERDRGLYAWIRHLVERISAGTPKCLNETTLGSGDSGGPSSLNTCMAGSFAEKCESSPCAAEEWEADCPSGSGAGTALIRSQDGHKCGARSIDLHARTVDKSPPPSRCDKRPDRLDYSERPCPLQESVDRAECTRARKRHYEPGTPLLKRVTHQHCRNGEKPKDREATHSELGIAVAARKATSVRILRPPRGHDLATATTSAAFCQHFEAARSSQSRVPSDVRAQYATRR
jgi:hypothetical protein